MVFKVPSSVKGEPPHREELLYGEHELSISLKNHISQVCATHYYFKSSFRKPTPLSNYNRQNCISKKATWLNNFLHSVKNVWLWFMTGMIRAIFKSFVLSFMPPRLSNSLSPRVRAHNYSSVKRGLTFNLFREEPALSSTMYVELSKNSLLTPFCQYSHSYSFQALAVSSSLKLW